MIKLIKDTVEWEEFHRACYNAQMALQQKLNITLSNFKEFNDNYDKHFYNEYGIKIYYEYEETIVNNVKRPRGGALYYRFDREEDLAWFLLKFA